MPKYWPILLAILVAALALYAGLQTDGEDFERWQIATRWTARAGFPFFILAFVASSLVKLWPGETTRALLRNRKWWGLAFASAHTLHLYALIHFLGITPEPRSLVSLLPGFAIYVVIYSMVATSWPWAYKALGRIWKRLHKSGMYIVWGVFTLAYFGKAMDPELRPAGAILLAIALAAFALRIIAWRKGKVATRAAA
ncbi:hypothetical protein [Altererythrobacter sp.]|uniref:hypothetical protein n=1 Tax=Altererythrobacter sp. TaxID=1872480 RepID=UPI003D02586C